VCGTQKAFGGTKTVPHKIAFVGKIGTGKTTLADYLTKTYGFKKVSFADAIKEIATLYFGMTTKDRSLLQTIGTKMREVNPDVWVRIVMTKLDYGPYLHVVIDDCRFLNEAKALKERGFVLVRLVGKHKEVTPEQSQHLSETEQDKILADYTLDTTKPLEETYRELDEIVKRKWNIVG
jgi:broad-specificity NMP kinase